jgi:hypothetical protein
MFCMSRRIIAVAWIAGATVPLLAGTLYLIGCCVLPFHAAMHELMPVCEMAASHEEAPASTPAPEKDAAAKRLVTALPNTLRVARATSMEPAAAPAAATAYRSFITLGAIRCDRDVGLHVLVRTFLV